MPNRRSEKVPGRGFQRTEGSEGDGQLLQELSDLPWELPNTFLGLDEERSAIDSANAVILPVPYEATTSYGAGAAAGWDSSAAFFTFSGLGSGLVFAA